ncbi:radical SAM protein, BA_1875 family [Halopelagius inordinatus]|uniref:Radical SAM protein, BA_1875 family n=1 Tax=Halopelagius inordinatus TaxID=553467 RepID=A0A1I2VI48_9EURY|nr:TIGR04053 family radical SAM/SPASM domain-containing protein [Halopelagius inordinatus]SFG88089.1 radical SAM protein, BA_1875 family [Halopelagius inordinatus]
MSRDDSASGDGPKPPHGGVDTDERPFVLVWEVTQACELACDHCRADARPNRHPDELTTEEGKRLLDRARAFGEGQLVVLSGGDPLARDDIAELVAYGSDIGLRVTLTPSGTSSLTRGRVAELADAGLKRMALSIDGANPAAHDDFRGERGSFDETLAAAEFARDAGIPLQVNTTVCRRTVNELPGIRHTVSDLGAAMWSVFFLVPVGRGKRLDPVAPDRADEVMKWLAEVGDEESFGLKTTEAPHYRRVRVQRRRENGEDVEKTGSPSPVSRRRGIVAGDGFAFVSHTGDIFPSGFLPESVGNVREDDVVERYRESELFRSLRDRDRLRGKCGACRFKALCGGSRSRAYAHTGDPLGSDPLCPHVPQGYDGPMPAAERRTES